MNVFNSLEDLPDFHQTAITIGSFDGVHSAHEKILQKVKRVAAGGNCESIVITFHPHPRLILNPNDNSLKLLTTKEEKIFLLKQFDLNALVFVPFSKEFANMSATEYIENFLLRYFHPKYIVIGYDHQFGKDRKGNIELLKQYAGKFNFEVIEIEKQVIDDISISSTKIRKAIDNKDLYIAERLLGHPYSIMGKVVRGKQIGRKIGFPTANVQVTEKEKLLPPIGIYAAWAIVKDIKYGSMLYIGDRPTIKDDGKVSIEVNIFDFDKDIYDEQIRIELVEFIRDDQKFDNLDELKKALEKDKIRAQYYLNPPK
ncbi:MAG: bifunctional riboflavin kinase/FAD synthetase [Saprospiraceae bacterium]